MSRLTAQTPNVVAPPLVITLQNLAPKNIIGEDVSACTQVILVLSIFISISDNKIITQLMIINLQQTVK